MNIVAGNDVDSPVSQHCGQLNFDKRDGKRSLRDTGTEITEHFDVIIRRFTLSLLHRQGLSQSSQSSVSRVEMRSSVCSRL